jgi:serine/threonine protein kinase
VNDAGATEPWNAEPPAEDPGLGLPRPFGRYELCKLLGKGGMGSVFLAHDPQLDRLVALKVPSFRGADRDALRERFLREARAAAKLSHPNLCPVYDVGEVNGVPYLTMAYVEGIPLSSVIRADRLPATQQVARWVHDIALAVHEVHRHGITHRDLKPSNIMVDRRGQPIVMDFGLAHRPAGAGDVRLTQSGALVGTPAYMAPEQAAGDSQAAGPASDVYSLGVVLYEMLTGRVPFEAPTVGKLLAQIERDPPPPPSRFRPGLDPALERVCLQALSKLPAGRFGSMAAFAAALAPFARGAGPPAQDSATSTAQVEPSRPRARRWWTGLGAAAAAVRAAASRSRTPTSDRQDVPDGTLSVAEEFGVVAYEMQLRRQRIRRRWIALGVAAILLIGCVIYAATRSGSSQGPGKQARPRNPFVTRENYIKIEPGMEMWEVTDLLGAGEVVEEVGYVRDASGNFRRWSRNRSVGNFEDGTESKHDGKLVRMITQTVEWRSGDKAIVVTFENDKAIRKNEVGLYREQ